MVRATPSDGRSLVTTPTIMLATCAASTAASATFIACVMLPMAAPNGEMPRMAPGSASKLCATRGLPASEYTGTRIVS